MAAPKSTVAMKLRDAMPVRTIVATVRGGADAGATWEGEEGTIGTAQDNALVIADDTVSRYHVRVAAVKGGIEVADFGSTNGTFLGEVRVERCVVPPGTLVHLGKTAILLDAGRPRTIEIHDEDRLGALVGRTERMRRLMKDVRRVAPTNVPVLLIGESGTGKELLARAVQEASARAAESFVTVDCGSLAPTLVASELFGHEQGAFTGAVRARVGAFEHANGGTLFLDEIGELSPELQTTLLGALERKRFCRVGGRSEIEVDVRVVTATNRDLRADVNTGVFRLDLYYRIAVVTLAMPALRERTEDIPLLIEHFMRQEGGHEPLDRIFPADTMARLLRHHWPGNVRELRNYVQATLAMGEPVALREEPIEGDAALALALHRLAELPYGDARQRLLQEFEAIYVKTLLERTHGNVARAAREAKISRSHLNELIRRHLREP